MNRRPIKPTLYAGVPQVETPQPAQPTGTLRREIPQEPPSPDSPDAVVRFRPHQRPPMAMIELLDDAGDRGEEFRVRADSLTIGRTNANIVIPHDSQISGNHVKVSRRLVNSEYHWFLTDLSSTNGTFLRVARNNLQASVPFIIGSYRYAYRPAASPTVNESAETTPARTRGYQAPTAADLKRLTAALVRIATDGTETDFPLPADGARIGSDSSQCQIVISDDPTVDRVHARIQVTDNGLIIEDHKSLNGLWSSIIKPLSVT
jgi:pSer/pThr/pTyr-binding forkhead associated (FHA) protein